MCYIGISHSFAVPGDNTPVISSPLGKEQSSTTAVKVKKTATAAAATATVQEVKETKDAKKPVDNVNSIIDAIERMLCIDKKVSDMLPTVHACIVYMYVCMYVRTYVCVEAA